MPGQEYLRIIKNGKAVVEGLKSNVEDEAWQVIHDSGPADQLSIEQWIKWPVFEDGPSPDLIDLQKRLVSISKDPVRLITLRDALKNCSGYFDWNEPPINDLDEIMGLLNGTVT